MTAAAYDPAHRVVTVEEHKTDRDGHARAQQLSRAADDLSKKRAG